MISYQIIDANPEWQDRPLTASPRFDAGLKHFRAAHSHAHCAGTLAYRFDDPPTAKPMKMFAADWRILELERQMSPLGAAAGVTPVGLRPSLVNPAAAHSHPDCRGILILIVAPQGWPDKINSPPKRNS
jgi:hypothetical protein